MISDCQDYCQFLSDRGFFQVIEVQEDLNHWMGYIRSNKSHSFIAEMTNKPRSESTSLQREFASQEQSTRKLMDLVSPLKAPIFLRRSGVGGFRIWDVLKQKYHCQCVLFVS